VAVLARDDGNGIAHVLHGGLQGDFCAMWSSGSGSGTGDDREESGSRDQKGKLAEAEKGTVLARLSR